jgi:hypothetical protein
MLRVMENRYWVRQCDAYIHIGNKDYYACLETQISERNADVEVDE